MTPYDQHLWYMRGWADGAGHRPIQERISPDARNPYDQGYQDGQLAFKSASRFKADDLGVTLQEIHAV